MFPNPFIFSPPSQIGAPLEIIGKYFSGSFQSSADVCADLLAGQGEFQIGSGPSEPMEVVAAPEPGSAALFWSGLMLLMRRRIKRVCQLRPAQPVHLGSTGRTRSASNL